MNNDSLYLQALKIGDIIKSGWDLTSYGIVIKKELLSLKVLWFENRKDKFTELDYQNVSKLLENKTWIKINNSK